MDPQIWLEGVPKRPSKAELKKFIRARLDGFELRQAERARRRAEARAKRSQPQRPAAAQDSLPFSS